MTAGTGIHSSTGAAALAVKDALHDLIVAAVGADKVDVSYGYQWPTPQWFDAVALTGVQVDAAEGNLGPRQRRHVTVRQDVNITSFRVTGDDQLTHERAFALLTAIDVRVRETDPTLGGAALWCVLGEVQSDGATTEDDAGAGRFTEIAATFEARVLISS